ncbi:ABC transporter ATP-binding protein [Rhodothermus bifroesti]|uniref:ATP-binding cassette domain-containing protein n=1 Tax=Rhodothermus marinus TaxID=29549 RepID=A0A7V2F5G8_RHOMR|nr:ATP-binding cassette domain-containing protein [Rhodothermus bifroesti]GBD02559.1 putative ribonucleotide transport ATP-binding protein mkl [bacterium HR18]
MDRSLVSSGVPEPVVCLRAVYKRFGVREVLRGVTLEVAPGQSVVVMGSSGSGKSVLLKHLVRLLVPDQGEVWVLGQRVDQLEAEALDQLRLSIGYLFQSGALFDSMTVYENLDFLLERHTKLSRAERRDRILEMLDWVGLRHTVTQYPAELSGGQRKRIALARAMILEPKVLLYDEPTTGLDPASVRAVSELIVRLREERSITSVTITHDLLCAEIIADRAHFLHEGRILLSGTFEELRKADHPALRNFFGN